MSHPLASFGLDDFWPALGRIRRESVIAVNVAAASFPRTGDIRADSPGTSDTSADRCRCAALVNMRFVTSSPSGTAPWHRNAGPAPALVAAICALAFAPTGRAVAFVAGVSGPLVGADLLHLRDIQKISTGVASIAVWYFRWNCLSGIVAGVSELTATGLIASVAGV